MAAPAKARAPWAALALWALATGGRADSSVASDAGAGGERGASACAQDRATAGEREADALWAADQRLAAVDRLAALVAAGAVADPARAAERLARWQLRVHRYEGALDTLSSLGPELDGLRGEALYALTRYDEALAKLDARDPRHVLLRVDAQEALGRVDDAAAELERAAQLLGPDDARLASFQGRRLARAGEHAAAVARFRIALAHNSVDQRARFGLGRALLALGEREEGLAVLAEHRRLVPLIDALEFAEQSLDLAPTHAPNHAALAGARADVGLLDAAQASYRRAAELAVRDEVAPIALRHARFLEEVRAQPRAAVDVLAAALEAAADVRLAVRAGDVEARAGRAAAAAQWYRDALTLRPGDPAIESRLAAVEERERP